MTAVTPKRFETFLDETLERVREEFALLPELYERAYLASHSQAVRTSAGKITRGGHADPTEQIVGDPLDPKRPGVQAKIRHALERAPTRLADVENTAKSIEKSINSAMNRLDPHETFAPSHFQRPANQADIAEAEAAKRRRVERGEDIG